MDNHHACLSAILSIDIYVYVYNICVLFLFPQAHEKSLVDKARVEIGKSTKILDDRKTTQAEEKAVINARESKVLENREASLKALRDKLRAKEEHAKKVREAKRANSTKT